MFVSDVYCSNKPLEKTGFYGLEVLGLDARKTSELRRLSTGTVNQFGIA